MINFKINKNILSATLIIFFFTFSNTSYSKALTEKEFDQFIDQNNRMGVKLHSDLLSLLVSGDREAIKENLCSTYLISLKQYQFASENSKLKRAKHAQENALKNIQSIEEVIPQNNRPISTYCENYKLDS